MHRISTFAHTGTVVTAGGAVALRGGPHERGSFNLWRRGIRNLQFQYPDWIFCFVLCLPAGTHKISQSGFESARRFCVQKLRHTLRFSRSSKRRVWDSNLTGSVPRLDILFRFAHNLSQSGFESARRFCVQKLRHTLRFSRSSKRRVWDSNPRETFAPNTLARCRFRPLSQLSNTSF